MNDSTKSIVLVAIIAILSYLGFITTTRLNNPLRIEEKEAINLKVVKIDGQQYICGLKSSTDTCVKQSQSNANVAKGGFPLPFLRIRASGKAEQLKSQLIFNYFLIISFYLLIIPVILILYKFLKKKKNANLRN